MNLHTIFDALASVLAFASMILVYRWRLQKAYDAPTPVFRTGYLVALTVGAVVGGYSLGTLNLALSGVPEFGRSIVGALSGAIVSVEIFKRFLKYSGSTGLIFVAGFCATVIVGRIGCFLTGVEDHTHGTTTDVPWAHDFGDGLLRHPVQMYESLSMAVFLMLAMIALAYRAPLFMKNGFYMMVGFYAAQRFVWEFFKPYGTVLGPLNLFHLLCLGLVAYAVTMSFGNRDVRA